MSARVLVLGYGNPGRLDDGLGPALAEQLAALGLPGVATETAYQLQIEDADLIAGYDAVVFADAHRTTREPFELGPLEPVSGARFSTHSVAPAAVLAMAHEVFASSVEGFLLGIRGHEFDAFGERLTAAAERDLGAALAQLRTLLSAENPLEELRSFEPASTSHES